MICYVDGQLCRLESQVDYIFVWNITEWYHIEVVNPRHVNVATAQSICVFMLRNEDNDEMSTVVTLICQSMGSSYILSWYVSWLMRLSNNQGLSWHVLSARVWIASNTRYPASRTQSNKGYWVGSDDLWFVKSSNKHTSATRHDKLIYFERYLVLKIIQNGHDKTLCWFNHNPFILFDLLCHRYTHRLLIAL